MGFVNGKKVTKKKSFTRKYLTEKSDDFYLLYEVRVWNRIKLIYINIKKYSIKFKNDNLKELSKDILLTNWRAL